VGKSALVAQYLKLTFSQHYTPTITSTYRKNVSYQGHEYQLTLLDTAGLDYTDQFQPQYSIGTHGYVLLFDVADLTSFDAIQSLRDSVHQCHTPGLPLILVGAKADLRGGPERHVREAEARALAQSWGCQYVETSAKTGQNIERLFTMLLDRIQRNDEG